MTWSVGKRIAVVDAEMIVTDEIVSVDGGVVRVRVAWDRTIFVVGQGLRPARG